MKMGCVVNTLICLIIGAAIGSAITYYQVKCKTSGVNIRLDNGAAGPGITVTKTGNTSN